MLLQVINVLPIDILPSITGIDRSPSGLMNNRNKLIFNIVPALIFSTYICSVKKGIINKLLFSILLITIFISGGRAGAIIVLISVPYVVHKSKYNINSGNILIIICLFVIIFYFSYDFIYERTRLLLSVINIDSFIYQDQSVKLRLDLLNSTIQVIKENPIFGVGPGMFTSVSFVVGDIELNAHNTYMGIAAETGIIGVIAIIIFVKLPKIASKNKLSNNIYGIIFIVILLNALFYDAMSEPIIYAVSGVLIGRNARVN
jgi:O-antigen ligase